MLANVEMKQYDFSAYKSYKMDIFLHLQRQNIESKKL